MASAAQLNAAASIINGQGLTTNPNVVAQISTFQSQATLALLANCFATAGIDSNVGNVVIPLLDSIASNISQGQFLIDVYPSNISPVVTSGASISYHGGSLASASGTILAQAQGPFAYGMSGFANTFSIAQGYASSVFDTVSSLTMLNGKTYGKSGLGYSGITDLVTGGIGSESALLANVISGWGTMYDITNINLISDPYVFGQNILNQGLGKYGNLTAQIAATGLSTSDMTYIPPNTTVTAPTASTLTINSTAGSFSVPTVANVTTTTAVTGNNPAVIDAIYQSVTGANLQAIISATGYTSTTAQINSLADFLTFDNIVDPTTLAKLNSLGINNFTDFAAYLNSRTGKQTYSTWSSLADFLTSVSSPTLAYTTTTSSTPVLNSTTASTLLAQTGTGTGPFNNPIMTDYLGATSGALYTQCFETINSSYNSLIPPVYTAMKNLAQSVIDVYNGYEANIAANVGNTVYTGEIVSNITNLTTVLNSISQTTAFVESQTAYYKMLNKLSAEVANLTKAGVIFTSGPAQNLMGFGLNIGSTGGTDNSGIEANSIIANLITNDVHGDTIRAAISESINSTVTSKNNPNPRLVLIQAEKQNIPISTYISQNK